MSQSKSGTAHADEGDASRSDDAGTSTGLSPQTAAVLAYTAWWISGALFLVLEPQHPFVRFHARQALVGFGLVWVAGALIWVLSLVAAFVSIAAFRTAAVLAQIVWASGVVLWVVCLVQAARGRYWALPGLGRWAGREPEAVSSQP